MYYLTNCLIAYESLPLSRYERKAHIGRLVSGLEVGGISSIFLFYKPTSGS